MFQRKVGTAHAALSPLNSKAILDTLGCLHLQRVPTSFYKSDLGPTSRAVHGEMVEGLLLVLATPAALVRYQLPSLIAQVVGNRCVFP